MNKFYAALAIWLILLCFIPTVYAQQPLVSPAKKLEINRLSQQLNNSYLLGKQKALSLAPGHGWAVTRKNKAGNLVSLQGVNSIGFPVFLVTHNNTIAAATTGTNTVQPGGVLGLNLSGSGIILNNKLGMWDGGQVYSFHQEYAGKTITAKDNSAVLDHTTHVAGTMIAKGVYAPAKGMSFNAATLSVWDFNNDVAEMTAASAGLLLSNHSYGDVAGWDYNGSLSRWEWYGLPGDTVDYNFGFYDQRTSNWDNIAYNAPYYLMVESAGNSRSSNGPAIGSPYYGYASRTDPTFVNKGARPATISDNSGYDVISTTGNAKNILTIGAVAPILNGPASSQDVKISFFSSWGPTDDGRIKPDLVADGENVLSVGVASPNSYLTLSGTSMSAPNVTGSLYLLQEYYAQKNAGNFMLASTLKGLACHTAFDAGNPGPDYIYGWGLLDMKRAAQAITDNSLKSIIKENTLTQGQTQTFDIIASGNGPLAATISWTDPAGTPTAEGTINSRTPKLVNDLDIRVSDGTITYSPWVLAPDNPAAAAVTGDNIRDNIEQVYIANATPGKKYTIRVTHKGTLKSGSQAYALIATGTGGSAYCTSAPVSTADSRINNFTLANISNTPPPGCTGYADYTSQTIQLEQARNYPFSITLGTCGNNFSKAAKIYVDWNGNGIFDAGELAATTAVITGTGTYTGSIAVPQTVTPGSFSLLRVVLTETADTATITPCGAYAKGETEDYRVQFLQPAADAGAVAIVNAQADACAAATPVVVTLKNFGSAAITNIPVRVTVTGPNNTVISFTETFTGLLQPLEQTDFTLSQKFNTTAGATYNIIAETQLADDPITSNNKTSGIITVSLPPTVDALSAYYCNTSKQYLLTGNGNGQLLWYKNNTDVVPVAYGSPASTAVLPVNNTFYAGLNDLAGSVGPVAKSVFSAGGYNQFTPSVTVTTKIPVIIESARLYIGNSGKITFTVTAGNGQVVSATTINATATRSNPQPGPQADDAADQGKVYALNLLLPSAGVYTITPSYDNTATLYRNNGGVTGYPFSIGDIFSISNNTAASPANQNDTTYYKNFYYYFYNMQVKSTGCPSVGRQPVGLSKPLITQTGNILNSNFADGNQWFLNGDTIKNATKPTYTPLQSGKYQVTVRLNSGCVSLSDDFAYALTVQNPDKSTDIGLTIFPVPATADLNVVVTAKTTDQLNIALINNAGQIIYRQVQAVTAGNFSTTINVAARQPGVYTLKLILGKKVYARKIIVSR